MSAGEHHYTGTEGRIYHEKKRAIPAQAFEWVARLRAEKIQPYVGPSDCVFEYGVGSGWNLATLHCREKVGYDVSAFLEPALSARSIRFVSEIQRLPAHFAEKIICHHTLEHVISPSETLAVLKGLIRPAGKLLLFVPFEKEARFRRFNPTEPNHHLYSWNVQSLGNLVSECGWKVESANTGRFGYDRFAAVQAVRLKLGEPGFRLIRSLVHLVQSGLEVRLIARPKP